MLDEEFELKKEKLIDAGEHSFSIDDISPQRTHKDGDEIVYLRFHLTDDNDGQLYNNLLSCPLNERTRSFVSYSSVFHQFLS